jgi:hypothetical protein
MKQIKYSDCFETEIGATNRCRLLNKNKRHSYDAFAVISNDSEMFPFAVIDLPRAKIIGSFKVVE